MSRELLHMRLESLRAQLIRKAAETGNLRDTHIIELSQRLDILVNQSQKLKAEERISKMVS